MNTPEQIAQHFDIAGSPVSAAPTGNGHINDTFRVATDGGESYILQRINHSIFPDVELLQDNIAYITGHIRGILVSRGVEEIDRRVITLIPARSGRLYHHDGSGYWRMMLEIKDSVSHDSLSPALAEATGAAFGDFQQMLSSAAEGRIRPSIENFHNVGLRVEQLRDAMASDPKGRLRGVEDMCAALLGRADGMMFADRLHAAGALEKRIVHCDTKVNNVLFDRSSGEFLCVIDLDTTMPGYVLSDYGDFIRTAGCTAAEDEPDTSKVGFAEDIFESFTDGYLSSAAQFLSGCEVGNLAAGAAMMTYMQAVRFLTDYIAGDTYYKTAYPEHNLVRARAQYAHLEGIEKRLPQMQLYINEQMKKLIRS